LGTTKRHRAHLQRARGLQRTCQVWDAYIKNGWTQQRIAEELGISQAAVSKALARGHRDALGQLREKVSVHRAKQLARLEYLYRLAVEGLERSIGERVRTVHRVNSEGVDETERWTEMHPGNPRWLTEALGALRGIAKLLGLNAPIKLQPVEPNRPFADRDEQEIRAELADLLEKANIDPATLRPASKTIN
jgi:predicted transcriptional regulator